jgi:short-subunit dehydrogenase
MRKFKRAVITGASSGIGKAFAKELATQGVNLVIAARRVDELNNLAHELSTNYKIKVDVFPLDLHDPESPQRLFEFSIKDNQEVDLLINNAGSGPYRHFLQTSLKEHQNMLQLNVNSLTSLSHLFANHMIKVDREASILNLGSVASYQEVPRFAAYCGSKSYVKIFSEILSYELKDSCVSVTCLCPGGTNTEFLSSNNQKSLVGDKVLMGPEVVVKVALKGVQKKKTIVIPGFFNKLTCFYPRFLPGSLNLWLSEKVMKFTIAEKSSNS